MPRSTTHRLLRVTIACFVGSVGILLSAHARGDWSDVVVFGDSLSDVGNVQRRSTELTFGLFTTPDDRYDRGRFSNGDVWIERLADELGLSASARSYQASGTNYAYGGATTGSGTSNLTIVRNVGWQIDEYLVREARSPSADTLVVLWAGANNFLDGGGSTTTPTDQLVGYLERLYDAGARQFLVPNLPPLGETPRFVSNATQRTDRNAVSAQHNTYLGNRLDAFALGRDADVFALDIESLFFDLLGEPAAAGITNTTTQAINLPAGTDAAGYLFWDDVHPTATGHELIAQAALALLVATGDYDGSGQVEQGDLDLVLQNWGLDTDTAGTPVGWVRGFPEGQIEQAELDRVLQNWGSTSTPGFGGSSVPEPAAAVAGVALLLGSRRRRGPTV